MTLAPWPAAVGAGGAAPGPPPMTKRSTSYSAMAAMPLRRVLALGDRLTALLHFILEGVVDLHAEFLRPLPHPAHAHLDGLRLVFQQLLAERRLVEGHEILQLLLGEFV